MSKKSWPGRQSVKFAASFFTDYNKWATAYLNKCKYLFYVQIRIKDSFFNLIYLKVYT